MFMFGCQLKCHFTLADMMAKIVNLETLKITGILFKHIIFAASKIKSTL